jgi:hypothetical protein
LENGVMNNRIPVMAQWSDYHQAFVRPGADAPEGVSEPVQIMSEALRYLEGEYDQALDEAEKHRVKSEARLASATKLEPRIKALKAALAVLKAANG